MITVLVVIGIIAVAGGMLLSKNGSADSSKSFHYPEAASSKIPLGLAGIACFGIALVSFYNSFAAYNGAVALVYIAASVGLVIGGVKLLKAASAADERAAKNMAAHADISAKQLVIEQNRIALENARQAAENQRKLEDERRRTEFARLDKEQRAIDFDKQQIKAKEAFIPLAQNEGLDVGSYIGFNSEVKRRNLEVQDYALRKDIDHAYKIKEKNLELSSADETIRQQLSAADIVDYRKITNGLEEQLKAHFDEYARVEKEETNETIKKRRLAQLERQMDSLEEEIHVRKNRFLSSGDGQETRRLT